MFTKSHQNKSHPDNKEEQFRISFGLSIFIMLLLSLSVNHFPLLSIERYVCLIVFFSLLNNNNNYIQNNNNLNIDNNISLFNYDLLQHINQLFNNMDETFKAIKMEMQSLKNETVLNQSKNQNMNKNGLHIALTMNADIIYLPECDQFNETNKYFSIQPIESTINPITQPTNPIINNNYKTNNNETIKCGSFDSPKLLEDKYIHRGCELLKNETNEALVTFYCNICEEFIGRSSHYNWFIYEQIIIIIIIIIMLMIIMTMMIMLMMMIMIKIIYIYI